LRQHGISLLRGPTATLQVNLGLKCNQLCRHCHLEAGPERSEMMDLATVEAVADYAQRGGFAVVDITGGAPELHPHLERLIELASGSGRRVMLRANLTALGGRGQVLMQFLAAHEVVVVASFPSLTPAQAEAQRGGGVFQASLEALDALNRLGYGRTGSGLELNLVVNPGGAFLPPAQAATARRFHAELARRWGLAFNQLYCFANAPLGRFKAWLQQSGNYEDYLERLATQFNACATTALMCRNLVSVSWQGHLYDCDFNQAAGLPLGGKLTHVAEMAGPPPEGQPIAVGEHCYTCTAGAGFT
jgi:radical SAM/Cys-rich protein